MKRELSGLSNSNVSTKRSCTVESAKRQERRLRENSEEKKNRLKKESERKILAQKNLKSSKSENLSGEKNASVIIKKRKGAIESIDELLERFNKEISESEFYVCYCCTRQCTEIFVKDTQKC